jgi:SAM-dependent methyltransferase
MEDVMLCSLDDNILLCPVCKHGSILRRDGGAVCAHATCGAAFPVLHGQPCLIDFNQSVVDRDRLLRSGAADLGRRPRGLRRRAMQFLFGTDRSAAAAAAAMRRELAALPHRPRLLVIGGGTIGAGAASLYQDPGIDVVAFDVYASTNVQLVADAHSLPFLENAFDAVWIQAVLEHVLEPAIVVGEIHRVLKPGGIVFAGTPFMQQVHEGPYDFTRFTESGHRWLFRRFERIDSGVSGGPGTAAIWSIRYLTAGIFRSRKIGWLAAACLFWLRFLDYIVPEQACIDAACGVWLLGRKSSFAISPRDAIASYRGWQH